MRFILEYNSGALRTSTINIIIIVILKIAVLVPPGSNRSKVNIIIE